MNRENLLYLKNISKKSQFYFDTRKKALMYISENNLLDNKDLCVSILLISALWAANKFDENLSEDDLVIYFSLEAANNDDQFYQVMSLSEEHKNLSLKELQDITVQTYKS